MSHCTGKWFFTTAHTSRDKPAILSTETVGVRQGCILTAVRFSVAIDWIIQHMSFNLGIAVGTSTFTYLNCLN